MEKIQAPIDQKNILEDALLEQIFDNGEYLRQPNTDTPMLHLSVGWIQNDPFLAMIEFGTNELTLIPHFPQGDKDRKYIYDILTQESGNTYCEVEYHKFHGSEYYTAKYYFKVDEV